MKFLGFLIATVVLFQANARTGDVYVQLTCKTGGQTTYLEVDRVIYQEGKLVLKDAIYPYHLGNYKIVGAVDPTNCEISASNYRGASGH